MGNIKNITTEYLCSGCGTCNAVCTKSAISMVVSNMGWLHANIDEAKCIDCGLCLKVCPKNNVFNDAKEVSVKKIVGNYINCYIGRSLNKTIYSKAQSGGIVTSLLMYLFKKQMVDAAVVSVMDYGNGVPTTNYKIVTNPNDLLQSQKSIYTPVDPVSASSNLKRYESVAVVGIPCQIQGFTNLQKIGKCKNIKYKIGLICDKVESGLFANALIGSKFSKKNLKLCYRMKGKLNDGTINSYKNAPIVIDFDNGKQVTIPNLKRFVLKDMFTLPTCRICFDKLNTFADIVCGDPWGIEGKYDEQNGDSLFFTRSQKFEDIIHQMVAEKEISSIGVTMDEIISGQLIEKRVKSINSLNWQMVASNWAKKEKMSRSSILRKASITYQKAKIKSIIKKIF